MDYDSYVLMVYSRATSWHKTTGIDWDECVGIANLGFAEAQKHYDPEKGSFSNYLWRGINIQFSDHSRLNSDWEKIDTINDNVYLDCLFPPSEVRPEEFIEMVLSLPDKCQKVILYILENPNEFCYKGTQATRYNGKLTAKITKMGHSWKTSKQIIKEIKKALKEDEIMRRTTKLTKKQQDEQIEQMVRTTTPRGWKRSPHHTEVPAGRFGEEGAPGFMLMPPGCTARKSYFQGLGVCVDLAICSWYCKEQCEKYHMFRKNAGVKAV